MLRPLLLSLLIVTLCCFIAVEAWVVRISPSPRRLCRNRPGLHHAQNPRHTTAQSATVDSDVATVIQSLQNLRPTHSTVDWAALEVFLRAKLPLGYKNWEETSLWADELTRILGDPSHDEFQVIFERVLQDGNFYGAADYARLVSTKSADGSVSVPRPWVVLVSGLSGVRKTTSLYQPWFQEVLFEALGGGEGQSSTTTLDKEHLPTGSNTPAPAIITHPRS